MQTLGQLAWLADPVGADTETPSRTISQFSVRRERAALSCALLPARPGHRRMPRATFWDLQVSSLMVLV